MSSKKSIPRKNNHSCQLTKNKGLQVSPPLTFFDLSSHCRARQAIHFGLKMRQRGFHEFVSGEERSGRMTETLAYLQKAIKDLPPPKDWVYLNNFKQPHRPKPYALPCGKAKKLKTSLQELIQAVKAAFDKTLTRPVYLKKIEQLNLTLQQHINQHLQQIQNFAHNKGYTLQQTNEGFDVNLLEDMPGAKEKKNLYDLENIKYRINRLTLETARTTEKAYKKIKRLERNEAQKAIAILMKRFKKEFGSYLGEWIDDLKEDILNRIDELVSDSAGGSPTLINFDEWYGVNSLVEHKESCYPSLVLEPRPIYENLFGSIKYRTGNAGEIETNFTMIRPGALHRAHGGILVLRAEMIASNPEVWEALKAALRDKVIRIEEQARNHTLPLLDAPEPHPIPLDIQVFLIGSPYWYYNFFFNDPDFRSYFKIKADIDPDLPATLENVAIYRSLIHQNAVELTGCKIDEDAVDLLLAYSSRWVGDCRKLSARFELIADVLYEACALREKEITLTQSLITQALQLRRERNGAVEEKSFQDILDKQVLIDVNGHAIGQVNGLSVLTTGDHHYGLPCRISARTYAGNKGILNIERLTDMAGPIQQKGALILEGFLNSLFAQKFPLSYTCSLTFEQNYADIEGDSASMAELMAIFSSLAGIPLRQDIAITGSMNQFGAAQPVGGVHYKVEGFHRLCKSIGLTGTQGVIIPAANLVNLTLRHTVLQDIKEKRFFIWPVSSVFEALELMTGHPCGLILEKGMPKGDDYPYLHFTPGSIFAAIAVQLEAYHLALQQKK